MALRVLHSSDWHLGKRLYHKNREGEFRLFLDWLLEQLAEIDLLLVSGDIFDTNTPPVWAQELYYRFLSRASQVCEIIIIAGNHDSAMFLEAPQALLKALRVHVVGNPSPILQGKVQAYLQNSSPPNTGPSTESIPELIPIMKEGEPVGLVCALPYLRDSYLRNSNWEEKDEQLQQGIAAYYQVLWREAEHFCQTQKGQKLPIIATGHLFASGASSSDDSVRELYIGSLGHFQSKLFPPGFDYIALGHIHQPQKLAAEKQQIRYSGAPLAFTFGQQSKIVLQIHFASGDCEVEELQVPEWQHLAQITGSAEDLKCGIAALAKSKLAESKQAESKLAVIWLELEHSGGLAESIGLREELGELAEQCNMEILRYRTHSKTQAPDSLSGSGMGRDLKMLSELSPDEVFSQRLKKTELPTDSQERLWQMYHSLLSEITLQQEGNSERLL